jgi:spore maturation protein CgeB
MADGLCGSGVGVRFIDVWTDSSSKLLERFSGTVRHRFPSLSPSVTRVNQRVVDAAYSARVGNALVTNGRELQASTVLESRRVLELRGGGIACYLCDDPFNPAHRCDSWLQSLPCYSLVVTTKRAIVHDLRAIGCTNIAYSRFGYNPEVHRPINPESRGFNRVDVAFAGNADRDRLPIIGELAERLSGFSIGLYGDGWHRWASLRAVHRPPVTGLDYSAAMSAATVCPCLVRRANRDGHVMRSFELPAIGAFMLAERTEEHQEIFDEGVHCEFWSSIEELADKARWYSANPRRAAELALCGHEMIRAGGHTYADRARQVLDMLARGAGRIA